MPAGEWTPPAGAGFRSNVPRPPSPPNLEDRGRSTTRRFDTLETDLHEAKESAEARSDELEESISATETGLERLTTRAKPLAERHASTS
ncbi:hypothetical protein [Streptomyces sp. Isolate_219]|uniref:hypothetical protein n=1 Tax=Streptomyces sp. Isolate_219 TaxID=2950110 RepID=UPI0021CA21FF|nr:hypothetical protein [Streptomyces sp. Isolate_219]MCR8573562.1 hypothetical protein [Streptomyces sp. Isolate_219]